MGAMAGIATVASGAMSAIGAIQEGRAAKTEGEIKAIRLQTQAEAGRVRAVQVGAAYAEDLNEKLANINAITASQGVGLDSSTQLALRDKIGDINNRERITGMSNERMKAIGYEADADAARRAGKQAMSASYFKAVPGFMKAGQGLFSMGSSFA